MATIAFDLNGTLMDPSALAEPLGGDTALVLRALAGAVDHGMALTLAGGYRPFAELIEAGLRRELEVAGEDPGRASAAVELLPSMRPFPEAAEALDVLAEAGHTLMVLTNSTGQAAETVLRNAGLRERFAAVRATDEVAAFKPDPRVYGLVPREGEAWLVAAHWWDVLGAGRAGLRTAWVARKERVLMPGVEVDVRGADLLEAARAIVAAAA
jgi:2-haloacid dehalogenase